MSHAEKGQATVETALCLPLVALLLAVLVQVGSLAGDQVRLWHAAREAARVAIVDPDLDAIEAAARRGGLTRVAVTVRPEPAYRVAGEPLTVSLTMTPRTRVPFVGGLVNGGQQTASASMRIEQP